MSAPRSGAPGQPAAGQPGAGQPGAGQPGAGQAGAGQAADSPAVPRQAGPGAAGEGTATRHPAAVTMPEQRLAGRLESLGNRAWQVVLGAAILTVAVGIILVAWPAATLTVVAVLLGAGLVISGVYRFIEGVAAKDISGGTRAADIVIGLLAIFIGLYCLRHHDVSIFLLALLVGVFWMVHGFTDLAVAASAPPRTGRGWLVVAGLIGIAAGAIVLFWPGISLLILLWALGFWLIFYGLLLAGRAFHLRRLSRRAAAAVAPAPAPA
jgi:uncharacterized membrane protein HdeD (DUF308 family)